MVNIYSYIHLLRLLQPNMIVSGLCADLLRLSIHYRNLLVGQLVQLIDQLVNGLGGGGY